MASGKKIDEVTGTETTGHEWDGIAELNTPLPRWWLYIFYASIVWAVVYWVFMPAIPGLPGGEATRGLRDHSERVNVVAALDELHAQRNPLFERLAATDLGRLSDPENSDLLQFALAAGESAFGDNCRTCHGAGGASQPANGYPILVDDDWLWGGAVTDIKQTIQYGIRNEHPQSRLNVMQAYGRDGLLTEAEIGDLVQYLLQLSGRAADPAAAMRATELFEINCVACHGANGRGDPALGVPNLTDDIWLYGGEPAQLRETLWNGRVGAMPAWVERLDDSTIDALAIYVAALDGNLTN